MARGELIKPRRGTLAQWAAAETVAAVLADGEMAWISDEKSWVVGDGTTKVASLPRSGSGTYAALADAANPATLTGAAFAAPRQAPIYLNERDMNSASGSPTESTISAASTIVPVWQLPKAGASSIAGVISGLPPQCVGVQVDVTIVGASDASASTATLRIVGTPLVDGATFDTKQFSDNVVLCNALPSANGMAKKQRLETFLPVDDLTVPLAIRVIREVADGLDTWGGNLNIGSVRVTPVLAPTAPATITAASGYNSWPFLLQVGGKLTVIYGVGVQHGQPDSARKVVSRTQQTDGTWSAEATILDTAGEDDRAVGKGYDASGNPLLWTCTTGVFHLHRTTDGGATWPIISSPTSGWGTTPIQVTDVINLPSSLLCFWHSGTTDGNCAYGVVTSTDGGATWTQTVIASGLTVSAAPTEISGAYIGSNKIIAIGRCETGDTTSNSGMHLITSSNGGSSWAKNRSNIFDHYKSTPSVVWDGTNLAVYYYRRLWGDLRRRVVDPNTVFSAPRAWPASEVVAVGGSRADQDAGNVNALIVGSAHKVAYYSGDATNTAIMLATA